MTSVVPRSATGIAGLDDVLGGGLPSSRLYLVLGHPGTGKTTLGMQFLREGAIKGERVLYVSLSETKTEIHQVASSHGWSLDGVDLYELTAAEQVLGLDRESSMFDPSEVEFRETSRSIVQQIDHIRPSRVVFDSLSELAMLARDPLAFRRELLMLKQVFIERGSTVLLLSDQTTPDADLQLQSLTHGVITLEELAPKFGAERRRLRVLKLRGSKYRGGYHDYRIDTGGLVVFPRLIASEHGSSTSAAPLSCGVPGFDELLGGGLPRGNSTLLMGPAGSGKSSIIGQFVAAALAEGEPATLLLFDEGRESFLRRSALLGADLRPHLATGLLSIDVVNAAELSPGELSQRVRTDVEQRGIKLIAIDSLNGYIHAMPEEHFLTLHIHEILTYLNQLGVTTVITLAQHGLVGSMSSPVDLTYVADAVVLMRFFEANGEIHRAISMVKNRAGNHEKSIREIRFGAGGVSISEPLVNFRGVLTGVPDFTGDHNELLKRGDAK
jgi:circadian clock protein KaiC